MKTKSHPTRAGLVAIALGLAAPAVAFSQELRDQPAAANPQHKSASAEITELLATIRPIGDSNVLGSVLFEKVADGVRVTARIGGLEKNQEHAFHVHEFGDLTADDGTSAGGHFNPEGHEHGLPDQENRHAGDFGNLKADDNGNATHTITVKNLQFTGPNSILGRTVIVHAKHDDGSQPTGNAGGRIGGGVIGLTKDSMSGKNASYAPQDEKADTARRTIAEPAPATSPAPRPDPAGTALGGAADTEQDAE